MNGVIALEVMFSDLFEHKNTLAVAIIYRQPIKFLMLFADDILSQRITSFVGFSVCHATAFLTFLNPRNPPP